MTLFDVIKKLFCKHYYVYVRRLYGDEINAHNGKRDEYKCLRCGKHMWK